MPVLKETPIETIKTQNKYLSSFTTLLLGATLIFIFAVIFNNLNLKKQDEEKKGSIEKEYVQDEGVKILKVKSDDYYYEPNIDINSLKAQTPWLEGITLSAPPVIPTLNELEEIYRNYRSSYQELNYENFSLYASSELKWLVDNNIDFYSETEDGIKVASSQSPLGKENFERIAIGASSNPVYFTSSQLLAKKLDILEKMERGDVFIYFDNSEGKEKLIKYNDYNNVYIVCFDITSGGYVKNDETSVDCDIQVNYVAESGKWKVLNEVVMVIPE